MRVLVCGGRDYASYDDLETVLSEIQSAWEPFDVIIHGAAPGADTLAAQYAERHKVPALAFPADWDRLGDAAGPIRNKQMLVDGKPDLVVAFPGGKGTRNMIRQATAAGVEVYKA